MTNEISGHILVVDDSEIIREPLTLLLELQGHTVVQAHNGADALRILRDASFDLILLDLMMPGMDGYDVLTRLKDNAATRHIPVLVISGLHEIDGIARCIELGAEDYLFKPFEKTILKARVDTCLAKKQWHDREQAYLEQIKIERQKSEKLLRNILPGPISDRLKNGETVIADTFPEVSVLFADIVGFTRTAAALSPVEIIRLLNGLFTRFDHMVERYGLEKIKTIGDSYMVAAGLPRPRADHAQAIAELALDMMAAVEEWNLTHPSVQIRIGISSGSVVAGVIGTSKFAYDIWGDVVNTADRMQSHGIPGEIQVSETTYRRLEGRYTFLPREGLPIKGKGTMKTYLLREKKQPMEMDLAEALFARTPQTLVKTPAP